MRVALVAALAALGLAAAAGEAIEVEASMGVRVPGESPTLSVSETALTALGMRGDDLEAVRKELARLNAERAALFKAVAEARNELRAAQKKVDDAVAALARQEEALHKFVCDRLPQEHVADYAVRRQLQPVIDWLKLSDDQASQLLAKQKELLSNDPRPEAAKASAEMAARTEPLTVDQRKAHIELLRRCDAFNKSWLNNIEAVLTEEQKQVWRARYRRAAFPAEPIPAPAAPAPNE